MIVLARALTVVDITDQSLGTVFCGLAGRPDLILLVAGEGPGERREDEGQRERG